MASDDSSSETPLEVQDELQNGGSEGDEKKQRLDLKVEIDSRGACQRHITVTIPREDINRYFDEAYSEMMPSAVVPGFRAGRAPRKLVESRYRKDVADQVKGSLLVDSVGQVTEENNLAAISEPDLDPMAIEVPEEGPLTFEFNLEVRPDFDLPEWKGLEIERPVGDFSEEEIDARLRDILFRHIRHVPTEGAAGEGDYVAVDIEFFDGDQLLSSVEEELLQVRERLTLIDGTIDDFGELLQGASAGDTRETKLTLSGDAPNADLRGKEIRVVFNVLEVKKVELPKLTPAILQELGDFESEEELRNAVRRNLERRLEYEQRRRTRDQVINALVEAADWELPPELLKRQAARELQRHVLELRRSGFTEQEILAHSNELRQNSREATARALREHFILERLSEEQKIEESQADYDEEISLIARQLEESPRRVRARLEKQGQMDALRNQIIERKTIDLILSHAKFKDVPFKLPVARDVPLDHAAAGEPEGTTEEEPEFENDETT